VAVAARPNVILQWVLLLAVTVQLMSNPDGMKAKWKQVITWAAGSLVPVGLVGIGLLAYNTLRFGDALDFGYAYMVGSRSIVTDIQQYGVLGFHYVSRNLETMFLTRPLLSLANFKLFPSQVGMSMFLTTPALFLLIGRYEKQWWIIGAWSAILLSVVFLSLFHNTGASQFGYRYVLDFILPILMLLAAVVTRRRQWLLRAAILLSMGINLLGANWYFRSVLGS
jgi:hypothetical protein